MSDSPPEKDVQWSEEGIISSYKFIQKLWTLHLKIQEEIIKDHPNDSSQNVTKFTNQFLKKITNNLNNFNYNIIIANLHEMHSLLSKEIKNEFKKNTLIDNYKKILISINPIIPHFSNECLEILNEEKKFEWPKYDEKILIEEFNKIVIQINGKKRGIIEVKSNIEEEELIKLIKTENNLEKYFQIGKIKKKFYVKNKLINIII